MNDLQKLKQLLFKKEVEGLARLQERLDEPQQRAKEISVLLPTAIRKEAERSDQLAQSLQDPVETCLRLAIKKDPRAFADALFPIMGPAIRRSISEALRTMLQSINQVLDQSFSLKGLSWRWEAWRSNVSFHEVVLRNTLVYRVEQLLFIQQETGLLIEHLLADDVHAQDPDAVSAMLSAIQDFVRDSFSADDSEARDKLDQIELGEHSVWLVHGPNALIAVVIRGMPSLEIRDFFNESLEQIHQLYADEIKQFDGSNDESLQGIRDLLEPGLLSVQKNESGKKISPFFMILLCLGMGLIGYWMYQSWLEHQHKQQLYKALNDSSGIVLQSMQITDEVLLFKGLRDPLSQSPQAIVEAQGFDDIPVTFLWESYYSAELSMAKKRVRQILKIPAKVKLTFQGNRFVFAGVADKLWISEAKMLLKVIPGVQEVDTENLINKDQHLINKINRALQIPDSLSLKVEQLAVFMRGKVSVDWMRSAQAILSSFTEIKSVSLDVDYEEYDELRRMGGLLESLHIYFDSGQSDVVHQVDTLGQLIGVTRRIGHLTQALGQKYSIELIGMTDNSGKMERNKRLALKRVENVLQFLTQHSGINSASFAFSPARIAEFVSKNSSEFRRVDFKLYLTQ